ncbi:hypothetical protein C8R44DRAFT_878985 [Mycena epipterygia]|nr:hypothetical protein C8R44DRAFT_878985 [Mycena epipterygia]
MPPPSRYRPSVAGHAAETTAVPAGPAPALFSLNRLTTTTATSIKRALHAGVEALVRQVILAGGGTYRRRVHLSLRINFFLLEAVDNKTTREIKTVEKGAFISRCLFAGASRHAARARPPANSPADLHARLSLVSRCETDFHRSRQAPACIVNR